MKGIAFSTFSMALRQWDEISVGLTNTMGHYMAHKSVSILCPVHVGYIA